MWVGSTLDTVDKAGNLREERIVVGVSVSLLVVVSRATDEESGRVVRVDKTHVVSIGPDFELTSVCVTLQGDGVGERSDGTVLVLPDRRSQTRDTQLLRDLALIDRDL